MQETMINQNIIIKEPSRNLRALGRNALVGKWKVAIAAVCLSVVVINLPQIIFDRLFGTNLSSLMVDGGAAGGMSAEFYSDIYDSAPATSILSVIYAILITGAVTLGISLFFLAAFRRHEVGVTDIFLGFEKFGKALGLMLFQGLFIFLWSLLLVVPGIIAAIRYSQAFFILADNPNKGIRQCMDESKAMMAGNIGKYFCMNLSFIGWLLICGVASGAVASIGAVITTNNFVIALFTLVGTLFVAPADAYIYATRAGFYEILAGHLIKETEPTPVFSEEARENPDGFMYKEIENKDEDDRDEGQQL